MVKAKELLLHKKKLKEKENKERIVDFSFIYLYSFLFYYIALIFLFKKKKKTLGAQTKNGLVLFLFFYFQLSRRGFMVDPEIRFGLDGELIGRRSNHVVKGLILGRTYAGPAFSIWIYLFYHLIY